MSYLGTELNLERRRMDLKWIVQSVSVICQLLHTFSNNLNKCKIHSIRLLSLSETRKLILESFVTNSI